MLSMESAAGSRFAVSGIGTYFVSRLTVLLQPQEHCSIESDVVSCISRVYRSRLKVKVEVGG